MKYKITKFTEEEKQDILERYSEWMNPENTTWVSVEFKRYAVDKLVNRIEKEYSFARNYAEKMWILEKLRDHEMHSSPYIDSRIGNYPIKDFNDETKQRILLEEMEGGGVDGQGFLSDFIEERIKLENCENFSWEMYLRQKLSDCEMHTTPYVAKRIGDYELPTPENGKGNWVIVCASNKASDRAGSNKIPSHCYSRCAMIEFVHDSNDWFNWAVKNDVHADILGFLNYQPNWLNVFDPKVIAPQPCPRSWTRLSSTLKTNPENSFIQKFADINVGETASIEFASFLQLKEDVPDLQKICEGKIDTPEKAKDKKKQNGIYFATVVALITVIKEVSDSLVEGYFENALKYIEQFPTPEYEVFFVRSLVNARTELVETTTFNEFKVKHQDLEV